jgi:hypothetical protein
MNFFCNYFGVGVASFIGLSPVLKSTVKVGYNELGYNERPVITNKKL